MRYTTFLRAAREHVREHMGKVKSKPKEYDPTNYFRSSPRDKLKTKAKFFSASVLGWAIYEIGTGDEHFYRKLVMPCLNTITGDQGDITLRTLLSADVYPYLRMPTTSLAVKFADFGILDHVLGITAKDSDEDGAARLMNKGKFSCVFDGQFLTMSNGDRVKIISVSEGLETREAMQTLYTDLASQLTSTALLYVDSSNTSSTDLKNLASLCAKLQKSTNIGILLTNSKSRQSAESLAELHRYLYICADEASKNIPLIYQGPMTAKSGIEFLKAGCSALIVDEHQYRTEGPPVVSNLLSGIMKSMDLGDSGDDKFQDLLTDWHDDLRKSYPL